MTADLADNERDLRQMEWLFHVDMPFDKHDCGDDLARTAKIAWGCIAHRYKPQKGLKLVVCVVKDSA